MTLNAILAVVAFFGLLISAVGRWMVASEARHLGLFSRLVIVFVPLGDVLFLVRNWEAARNGVFTGLVGLAFILPWAGKTAWDREHQPLPTKINPTLITGDVKDDIYQELKAEHEAKTERQHYKVQKLGVNLAAWYQRMEARRAALTTPEEIAAFNDEAAEYQTLNAEMKEEVARLTALQAKKYESWSQLTDAEILEYLRRPQHPQKRARLGAL
jgi:hypothetical protein